MPAAAGVHAVRREPPYAAVYSCLYHLKTRALYIYAVRPCMPIPQTQAAHDFIPYTLCTLAGRNPAVHPAPHSGDKMRRAGGSGRSFADPARRKSNARSDEVKRRQVYPWLWSSTHWLLEFGTQVRCLALALLL